MFIVSVSQIYGTFTSTADSRQLIMHLQIHGRPGQFSVVKLHDYVVEANSLNVETSTVLCPYNFTTVLRILRHLSKYF